MSNTKIISLRQNNMVDLSKTTALNTLIISHGRYLPKINTSLVNNIIVPENLRIFEYNFEVDYDNYYLSQIYKKQKILFFVNKNNGKILKKEFIHKEYSPGDKIPKEVILCFNNIRHMFDVESFIIHPSGVEQEFHNYGIGDPFIVSLDKLLAQLSKQYAKTFPNQVIEIHLSSHKIGKWEYQSDRSKKVILFDDPSPFSLEESQNIEKVLLNDFIVINEELFASCVLRIQNEALMAATT